MYKFTNGYKKCREFLINKVIMIFVISVKFVFPLVNTIFYYCCSTLWDLKSAYQTELFSQKADFNFGGLQYTAF